MEESVLWMDKYQPKKMSELTFHKDKNALLSSLAQNSEFPHLIIYGPEGAGKKTRMHCFLSEVYGEGIYKMNTFQKEYKNKSKNIPYYVTSSNYHLEFCPADSGINDKFIISYVIKETSSFAQLDEETQKSFKVIVLLEADKMSKDAQSALRRTMEKYSDNCRIIMIANDLSKIIEPIRSRCFALRIPSPSDEELKQNLQNIIKCEALDINDEQIKEVISKHGKNVRECINVLQMTSLGNYSDRIFEPEFSGVFDNIVKKVLKDRSAKALYETRSMFYELTQQGFSGSGIIYNLVTLFIKEKSISENCKKKIIDLAKVYDLRSNSGSKDTIHLEAFTANVMYILAKDN